jgi:putative transposon-encoded protein
LNIVKDGNKKPATVSFETTLSSFGNNTGIEVPEAMIVELGAGKRPAVVVNLNGYEYPNTVGVMGGKYLVSVSAAVRKETGLSGGDPIRVTLTIADGPRTVEIPADFAAALGKSAVAKAFFEGLSNSVQRFHVDNVNGAKTDETRQRRIEKAVALFVAGKQR